MFIHTVVMKSSSFKWVIGSPQPKNDSFLGIKKNMSISHLATGNPRSNLCQTNFLYLSIRMYERKSIKKRF